jgi:hypothetical protein
VGLERLDDDLRHCDDAPARVGLRRHDRPALTRDLLRLVQHVHLAMEDVDVAATQPEVLAGAEATEAGK